MHKDLWSGGLRTINATHHTISKKEITHHICKQSYRPGQRSRVMLREHIDKQLESGGIETAHSE